MLPEWNFQLRDWQERAFTEYQKAIAENNKNFLLVATPGAGKTRVSLRVAHYLFQRGQVERLVVVTPTAHLKEQWAIEAGSAGIQLDPHWSGMNENPSMHGVAITYQMVSMIGNDKMQRLYASRKTTLVIFDEIHHAGEQRSWGESIKYAFEPACYRLLLSGTPFRSDNFPIAFVNYDELTGICKPDFSYDYGLALHDADVCREVLFPSFNGLIEYMVNSEVVKVTFEDQMDEMGGSQRLRMALSPDGEWIKEVLTTANNQLQRIREDQYDAGGLIITIDQKHAVDVANVLETITHLKPIIAISDDPDASDHIRAFKESRDPWLVAVRMVSEGVDIPRLRVGVFATNVTSELFFRQAVGRIIRMQKGYDDQTAYFYIPMDERLINYARQIKEERDHAIQDLEDQERREREMSPEKNRMDLTLIDAKAKEGTTVYDSDKFSPEEIQRAILVASQAGVRLNENRFDAICLAKCIRVISPPSDNTSMDKTNPTPLFKRLEMLRPRVNSKANRLAFLRHCDFKKINEDLHFIQGKWLKECTETELIERLSLLSNWIAKELER